MFSFVPAAAAMIEFAGALVIAVAAFRAAKALLFFRASDKARALIAAGVIAGLDFKMGATLLKALSLTEWAQIGKFATILLLRVILKSTFSKKNPLILAKKFFHTFKTANRKTIGF